MRFTAMDEPGVNTSINTSLSLRVQMACRGRANPNFNPDQWRSATAEYMWEQVQELLF
jgi:hypothetical protein